MDSVQSRRPLGGKRGYEYRHGNRPGNGRLAFEWDFGDGSPAFVPSYLNGGTGEMTIAVIQ